MTNRVRIRKLPSGVSGLDEVLGGGIPEFSFNLVTGGPGCGKTTLGHQIAFANAARDRKALYFTIIGEPPIKMLRYQQQFSFFDMSKLGNTLRFVHLGDEAATGGLAAVLDRIVDEVTRTNPALVVVDSFRSMARRTGTRNGELELESFTQRLAVNLTSAETTSFLIGEYSQDVDDSPVFTVADGIISLKQAVRHNSVVRKLRVVKMRGQGQIPGLHTMRMDEHGLGVFPRLLKPAEPVASLQGAQRALLGVARLDEMLGGGIPVGHSVLVAGPSGSGKTLLSNQFIIEGAKRGEPGIIAVFEKRPNDYLASTPHGIVFEQLMREKKLEILYLRPLDLSIDETLLAIRDAVTRVGAKRAVIDSLSGLELALAPTFREDFRESLYRMVGALTGQGVTVMSTVEQSDGYDGLRFSPQNIGFLTDTIIMQRYVQIGGLLKRVLCVIKVRGSAHSDEVRTYRIDETGAVVMGDVLNGYSGLFTGAPRPEGK